MAFLLPLSTTVGLGRKNCSHLTNRYKQLLFSQINNKIIGENQTMPRKPAMPGIDRRQNILDAALSVFAEQGFEAATNKEIEERAGVNQGLIYF
jgi:hypothetical protein